jgi:hypothetical protein
MYIDNIRRKDPAFRPHLSIHVIVTMAHFRNRVVLNTISGPFTAWLESRRSYDDGKSSNKELMYLSLALLAAPLRVPGVARMSLPINNPCPMLPPPVSSSELETVTLGMG